MLAHLHHHWSTRATTAPIPRVWGTRVGPQGTRPHVTVPALWTIRERRRPFRECGQLDQHVGHRRGTLEHELGNRGARCVDTRTGNGASTKPRARNQVTKKRSPTLPMEAPPRTRTGKPAEIVCDLLRSRWKHPRTRPGKLAEIVCSRLHADGAPGDEQTTGKKTEMTPRQQTTTTAVTGCRFKTSRNPQASLLQMSHGSDEFVEIVEEGGERGR